ncbi:hypothetical protein [Megasphaera sueciensis]|uniref:hypothetical protein n=1 Tax=Megasphaera sueciensis TaxID=349094 RepID=UPI003CFCE8EE
MSKIKLTDKEIERLSYLAVEKADSITEVENVCKDVLVKYMQARKYFSKINGEKVVVLCKNKEEYDTEE